MSKDIENIGRGIDMPRILSLIVNILAVVIVCIRLIENTSDFFWVALIIGNAMWVGHHVCMLINGTKLIER